MSVAIRTVLLHTQRVRCGHGLMALLLLQVPGDQVQTKSEADDNLLLFYRNVILSNVVVQSETTN